MIMKMTKQSAVAILLDQTLVIVMVSKIYSSLTMPMKITVHEATLVAYTNILRDTDMALHKQEHYWRASITSHQLRLRFSAVRDQI
jgi:hypothetical protein